MGGESLGRRRRGCLGWERGGAGGAQPTDQVTPNCTNRTKYPGGHSSTTNSITLCHALCHTLRHTTQAHLRPQPPDDHRLDDRLQRNTAAYPIQYSDPKTTRTWQIPPTQSHDTAVKSSFGLDAPNQRFHRSLCTSGSYLSLTCLLLLIVDVVRGDLRFPLCIRNR